MTPSHRRNEILFYTLLGTLVVAPLLAPSPAGTLTLQALLVINIIAALTTDLTRPMIRAMLATVIFLVLVRVVAGVLDSSFLERVALTLLAGTALFAAGRSVQFALRGNVVDSEHVFAALSAYLLAGVFCGVLYWQIEQLSPGSIGRADPAGEFRLPTAVYFSFMTLATVGFGDIVPRSDLARGLATLEAVAGQLYMAVLVARLLGLYTGPRTPRAISKP